MTIYIKICRKCKIEKPLSEYTKNKANEDGHSKVCKECDKENRQKNKEHRSAWVKEYKKKNKEKIDDYYKKYRQENKEKIAIQAKECHKRFNERHAAEIEKKREAAELKKQQKREAAELKKQQKREAAELKKQQKQQKREARSPEEEREARRIYDKEWRDRNREELARRQREKKQKDPLYKLKCNIRTLISNSITNKGYKKNSKCEKILGCSFEELISYLESKFIDGMSWENRHLWDIDHNIPMSWAESEEEILALNHYTNLQPLWKKDNIIKRNHYSGDSATIIELHAQRGTENKKHENR